MPISVAVQKASSMAVLYDDLGPSRADGKWRVNLFSHVMTHWLVSAIDMALCENACLFRNKYTQLFILSV